MATRSIANKNNFIRWDKINGTLNFIGLESSGIPKFIGEGPSLAAWSARTPAEIENWQSVAFGNDVFIAVGLSGTNGVMRSTNNGQTWSSVAAPELNQWRSVTYGDGTWVAVASLLGGGGTQKVMTSTDDGLSWTIRVEADALAGYSSVTYGNNTFVAVAQNGTNRVMTSPDGITWTARTAAEANAWESVIFDGSQFVAVAQTGTNKVMTSPDGITWTARSAPSANWISLAFGNGIYVAVAIAGTNRIMTSTDAITWTSVEEPETNSWEYVAFGGSLFVAVADTGTNRVMYSEDGFSWTLQEANPTGGAWQSVAFGNNTFVAVDSNVSGAMTSELIEPPPKYKPETRYDDIENVAVTAFNGETLAWFANLDSSETDEDLNTWKIGLINQDNILAYPDFTALKVFVNSFTLSDWATVSSGEDTTDWNDVAFGAAVFVAVGDNNAPNDSFTVSADGVSWGSLSPPEFKDYYAIEFFDSLFVTVGNNAVATSSDGSSWNVRTAAEANAWRGVTFGNGRWVAVSSNGTNRVMYSDDTITWTSASAAEANQWQAVAYGNNVYVAVSSDGTNRVMVSPDGITWSSADNSDGGNDIIFANGVFIIVGDNGILSTSPDGTTWTARVNPGASGIDYSAVTSAAGAIFATAYSGGGGRSIIYSLDAGETWIVQDSTTLSSNGIAYGINKLVGVDDSGASRARHADFSGLLMTFYSSRTVSNIENDCYRMVVYDTTNVIKYISNKLKFSDALAPFTKEIRYRNSKNILNFNYESLTSFYNQFRIDLVIRQAQYPVTRIGYELVNGSFNAVRSVKGRTKEFITEQYNELDHEAWQAATIHDLEVFIEGAWEAYIRGQSEASIEWQENYPLADGSIRLERQDTFSSSDNV